MATRDDVGSVGKRALARPRRALLLAGLALALGGCGAVSGIVAGTKSMLGLGPKPVTPDWESLALRADPDANGNSAVAVDVVLVKDQALLDALVQMPAAKWFNSRADLQRSYPEGLAVISYELVPGQTVKLKTAQWREHAAWAALVFAGYAAAGEHRARLLLDSPGYTVQLGAHGFSASDLKPGLAR